MQKRLPRRAVKSLWVISIILIGIASSSDAKAQFPNVLSAQLGHWDATTLDGFEDGDLIGRWPDVSGNQRDFRNAAPGPHRPIYRSSVEIFGGQPAVFFSGNDQYYSKYLTLEKDGWIGRDQSGAITQGQACVFFWVVAESGYSSRNSAKDASIFFSNTETPFKRNTDRALIQPTSKLPSLDNHQWQANGESIDPTTFRPIPNRPYVISAAFPTPVDAVISQIGQTEKNSRAGFKGYHAEMMIFSSPLSLKEVETVTNHLMNKYSIFPGATMEMFKSHGDTGSAAYIKVRPRAPFGKFTKVDFFIGKKLLGTVSEADHRGWYQLQSWTPNDPGSYSVSVVAKHDSGKHLKGFLNSTILTKAAR